MEFARVLNQLRKWQDFYTNEARDMSPVEWLLASTMFCVVAMATTTAWSTGGASIALALITAAVTRIAGYKLKPAISPQLLFGAIVCLIFMAASIFWAYETHRSIRALAIFAALGMGLLLANGAFTAMPQRWRIHLARAASASFIIFLFYGFFEEVSNHQLKRILFWPFQALSIDGLSVAINWSHISEVRPHRTNWNMATLSILLWPILFFVTRSLTQYQARITDAVLCFVLLVMVAHSQHETSMLAFVFGCGTYYLARATSTWTLGILALAWVSIFVLVVPISNALFTHEIHRSEHAPDSFKHRVVLWKYTADRIAERPILGVGLGSTHPMNEAVQNKAERASGTTYRLQTGTHPHNIYLEVWYEIGLVGVICVASFGLAIIYAISQLAPALRNYACAAFAVTMTTSLSSFGWYETWYASTIALCCALFFLVTRINRMDCIGHKNNQANRVSKSVT